MVRVGLVRSRTAFLPELEAYLDYFRGSSNIKARAFDSLSQAARESDILLFFFGFYPFWRFPKRPLIAEYHSLSVQPFAKLKNAFKRTLNPKAAHYIFLNERVRSELFFSKSVPHSVRGMGYHPGLVAEAGGIKKEFDFVYAGSLNRSGVEQAINRLAEMGFTVLVVGSDARRTGQLAGSKIECAGKVSLGESYRHMARARYGLNFTPAVYPYMFQDSTKVIEYCALGLGVVTNRYPWVDNFELATGAKFLDFDSIQVATDVTDFEFVQGNVKEFAWPEVIRRSGIEEAIEAIAATSIDSTGSTDLLDNAR